MTAFPTHEPRSYVPVTDCPACDGTSWAPRWDPTYGQHVGIPCQTCAGTGEARVAVAAEREERAA